MKNKWLLLLLSVTVFSCHSNESAPTTDIETAGTFMKNIWQLDFAQAEKFVLKDETNTQVFSRFEQFMKTRPQTELDKYKGADFIINDTKAVNDSVSIISYSGSFNKTEKTDLKLVRKNGQWLVDIKYTIPQTDTSQNSSAK